LFDVAADDKTDNWFAALPSCLPYNTFTLKVRFYDRQITFPCWTTSRQTSRQCVRWLMWQKLSVKKNLHEYWEFLQDCEETGLYELRKLVEAGKAEFEEKKLLEESKHASKGEYRLLFTPT
jgi:hypothetical protein